MRSPPVTPSVWSRLASRAARLREDTLAMIVDVGLVVLTFGLTALLLSAEGWMGMELTKALSPLLIVGSIAVVGLNGTRGLYSQVWRHASIVEARRHAEGAAMAFAVVLASSLVYADIPTAFVLIWGTLYTGAAGVLRFQNRLLLRRRSDAAGQLRLLLVGAGDAAASLLRDVNHSQKVVAVGIVDDDPRLIGRRLGRLQIQGPITQLSRVALAVHADQIVLAIPRADQALVRRVADQAEAAGIPLKVLPPLSEVVGRRVTLRDVRDLDIQDLLGRAQVTSDLQAVRHLIQDKIVLVTGAGGSIGSEIARQVAGFDPGHLLLLDRDETHLFEVTAQIDRPVEQLLVDVRDASVVNQVFRAWRPDLVFHAAAHKHVPMLEAHPLEAVRTNTCGSAAVVRAAAHYGTLRFVFISTDKAVQPSSVMGASKRFGEQLVLRAQPVGSAYCAVRFGNVLGSRGSVVPTFLEQIRRGGPVTITDSRMTRYFMSIPEAVQLVLQSAALAKGGDVFMLDMGEPVSIQRLAERLVRLSGLQPERDIEIRVTGVRPGEKLHEELHEEREAPTPTEHASILRLCPENLPPDVVDRAVHALRVLSELNRPEDASRVLFALAAGDVAACDDLLSLRDRRRATDRGIVTQSRDTTHPGRRVGDRVIDLDRVAQVSAWTSSTT